MFGNFGTTVAASSGVASTTRVCFTAGSGTGVGVGVEVEIATTGVEVGAGSGAGVGAGVGVGAGAEASHVVLVIVFVSNVTAPLRANTRPSTFAPVVRVAEVKAKMLPLKTEFAPSVTELPICQKTLQARAPLLKITLLAPAVMSVEAVLKMKTALESP